MRAFVLTLAALSVSACTAQPPADDPTGGPLLDAPSLEPEAPGMRSDLEAAPLAERARLLAPFVGGPLSAVEDALGEPTPGGSTTVGRQSARYRLGGGLPTEVSFEYESPERVVALHMTAETDDPFAAFASPPDGLGLEGALVDAFGLMTDVDHGYAFWDLDDRTVTAEVIETDAVGVFVELK